MTRILCSFLGAAMLSSVAFATTEASKPKYTFNVPEIGSYKQIRVGTRDALDRYNTIYGATGLIFIPTAYVVQQGSVNIGSFFAQDVSGPSASIGLTKDVEVGGAWLDFDGTDDEAVGNAKVRIVPANFEQFELGVGVMDVVDAIDQTIYVVGSVDLILPEQAAERGGVALRAHAGVGTGYFSEKPFGGLELLFEGGFAAVGEYDSKTLNAALRYRHNENFELQGGVYSNSLMFGMNYLMRF